MTGAKEQEERKENGMRVHWSGWIAAGAGLFVVFSRLVCPTLVMILGVLMVIGGLLLFLRPGDWRAIRNYLAPGDAGTAFKNWAQLIFVLIIILMLVAMSLPNCGPPIPDRAKNAEIRQILSSMRLSLVQYADANGDIYPIRFDDERLEEFGGYPRSHNPYAYGQYRHISHDPPQELYRMQQLGADRFPDELREYLLPQGGYCYIPIIGQTGDEEGQVLNYLLFGIGNQRREPGYRTWAEDVPVVVLPEQ